MVPTDQRLKADQLLALSVDQRLEDKMELLGGDALREIALQANPVFLFGLKLGRKVARDSATGILRLVQREIGLRIRSSTCRAVDRAERATDRDADTNLRLVDHIWFFDRIDDLVGQRFHLAGGSARR